MSYDKSDIYKVSLNDLIISSTPKSIKALEEILDDNGYYGRYRIITCKAPKSNDLCIKIEVYLPDSIYHYVWPYNTHYNLSTRSFGKRTKPAVINNKKILMKCMGFFNMFSYIITGKIDPIAEIAHLYMGWATKAEYIKMITFLCKVGLFNNGEFCLKTVMDSKEVHDNLFDPTYY
jgi:hypothetical protein